MSRIVEIVLDDTGLPAPSPEIEQERRVAIFDLLEDNSFVLPTREDRSVPPGPYRLDLSIRERLLVFDIADAKVVKDYFQICESYFDAVKTMPPSQIETIDMARRGIHNEGARVLQERLEGKAEVDIDTARRLFTLICVLHFGG
jgi:uncharacterized protein (UPF0262 family)